jgi:hypothetical protein
MRTRIQYYKIKGPKEGKKLVEGLKKKGFKILYKNENDIGMKLTFERNGHKQKFMVFYKKAFE